MAYTNSALVSYTKISPNRTKNRNHSIDTITIHCVVGQCTVEALGEVFSPESRQASSNYGIGYDGRIGMYCEEKDRSWCSSNAANDHRAITIEVASDTTHPYAVTDKAYAALLDLCTDICKRNGIRKLVWSTDKNTRVNHLNGTNMTVHRDYANKSCPGDYLYERHSAIAEAVNKRLGTVEKPAISTDDGDMTDADMFAFFKSQGMNDYGVAGLLGNLYAESGLKSNNLQNNGNTKLGMTDEQFTAAVDSGRYTVFVHDGYGYGLAQWTYYTRKQKLLDFMKSAGVSIGHKRKQCEFLMQELAQSYKAVLTTLKNAASVREASDIVLKKFEVPADQGEAVQKKRAGYAQTYYDKYAERVEKKAFPYLVRVSITDLNIRKGPGTNYAKTGKFTGKGVFTIVEESIGHGSTKGWGKLKSGAGWISLDFTEKI